MGNFDFRDIRPSMDVYTLDNVYLGTVLGLIPGLPTSGGDQVPREARQSSEINGEMLGPMPTRSIGNRGPHTQSAHELYAVKLNTARPIGMGAIRVGRWWGLVGRRTIPLDAVQTVSLERVVLRFKQEELERGIGSELSPDIDTTTVCGA
ncbi:MAG: hypothetical protein M5U01_42785 [Ardenticatenaceae bacterium]|nr:hypothetical protein [Ardenticatenaceae bacterium]